MLMGKRKNSRFYTILQTTMSHKKKRELALLIGDLNAKVGAENLRFERVTGQHRMGKMKKKINFLWIFVQKTINLIIEGTVFPHTSIYKSTLVSHGHRTENQKNHMCISAKFKYLFEINEQ